MTDILPNARQEIVPGQAMSPVWFNALRLMAKSIKQGASAIGVTQEQLAPILAALRSTDGEVLDIATALEGKLDKTPSMLTLSGLSESGFVRKDGNTWSASDPLAEEVTYDNTSSGLAATDVQAAIDEVAASGAGGAMSLVGAVRVTGTAATTITVSGLDLAADTLYLIDSSILAAAAATCSVYVNGDTTAANYRRVFMSSDVGTGSDSTASIGAMATAETIVSTGWLRADTSGYPRFSLTNGRYTPTSSQQQHFSIVRTSSAANVTSVSISMSVANSLAVGSYLRIFKVPG